MDPLTALSLAASIAQFLDFGSKLISTTREIKDAGQSVSIKHLSNITTDLTNFNLTLKRQINLDATQVELTKEQKVSMTLILLTHTEIIYMRNAN